MSKLTLKDQLEHLVKRLDEVSTAARGLQNLNFADIAATAKGRIMQLCDHPDLPLVDAALYGAEDRSNEPKPSDAPAVPNAPPGFTPPAVPANETLPTASTPPVS